MNTRVAAGRRRWFSHQQGGNRSGNGFPGLIGLFGDRRPNSPRVTGMTGGAGRELSIITRSQFRQDNRRMASGALRSDPSRWITPSPAFGYQQSRIHIVDLVLSFRRPLRFQFGAQTFTEVAVIGICYLLSPISLIAVDDMCPFAGTHCDPLCSPPCDAFTLLSTAPRHRFGRQPIPRG